MIVSNLRDYPQRWLATNQLLLLLFRGFVESSIGKKIEEVNKRGWKCKRYRFQFEPVSLSIFVPEIRSSNFGKLSVSREERNIVKRGKGGRVQSWEVVTRESQMPGTTASLGKYVLGGLFHPGTSLSFPFFLLSSFLSGIKRRWKNSSFKFTYFEGNRANGFCFSDKETRSRD